jgi:hypothetical protein
MFEIGQQVRVLEPFTTAFPDVYIIEDIFTYEDGTAYLINGEHTFDAMYLEAAQ